MSRADGRDIAANPEIQREHQVQVHLDRFFAQNKKTRTLSLKGLGLTQNADRSEVRKRFVERIDQFERRQVELQEALRDLFPRFASFQESHGVVFIQDPRVVEVKLVDPLLEIGRDGFKRPVFDHENNIVYVTVDSGKNILAHELVHATTFDVGSKTSGFMDYSRKDQDLGNSWMNEGVTMMAEFELVPTKEPEIRDVPDDLYAGMYWLTKRVQAELGLSNTELIRAYYRKEPERTSLDQVTLKRFGCTITELQSLFLGFNEKSKDTIERLLRGERVALRARNQGGMIERYQSLASIFSNVEVELIE